MAHSTYLELFEDKVKHFDFHERHRFNTQSRLLIVVPALDLKIGENFKRVFEKEVQEAEMFAEHIRETIGAYVLVLADLDQLEIVLSQMVFDCVIDLHGLHPKQRDFILEKLQKCHDRKHHGLIVLYPMHS